jgi:hypothetical protein
MGHGLDILWKYTLNSTNQGQTMQNVLWFRSKGNSPAATVEAEGNALIGEINSWFTLNLIAFANVGWSPVLAALQAMNGPQPYQMLQNYTNSFGAIAGDAMPPHDAAVLSLYTPFHGRRLHGRLYIGGLSESDQVGGLMIEPAYTRFVKIGADLLTRYGATGTSSYANVCVYSKKNGVQRNPLPPNNLIYDSLPAIPVSRITVQNTIRTQRHRMRH